VRRIHNKKTKNPSLKGKQYDGKVSYICKKNISTTLIVFFFLMMEGQLIGSKEGQ
jgi:hypothetical protein